MSPRGSRALVGLAASAAVCSLFTLVSGQQPPRTVNWDRARQAMSQYRTVIDSSGLVEVDEHLPGNIDATNLQALCNGRNESIRIARAEAERALRSMILDDDPISAERKAMLYRTLGAVSTYEDDVERAIKEFKTGHDLIAQWVTEYPDLTRRYLSLLETLAIGNLRKGEVDNCLVMTSQDRCVFPLRPGGVHHAQDGVDTARQLFEDYLSRKPDDLEVKWLLNLAYMLLGRYPKDVPAQHLLAPELFKSEAPMPRFYDVAMPTKLGLPQDIAGGSITDDFDGDGLIDVVFSTVDYCGPLRYFRNKGDGTFDDLSKAAGILGQLGGLNATQTDYDNDGRPDIYVHRGGWEVPMRNSLLRNNPDGTFTDVTKDAGMLDGTRSTHSVAWLDYDNDGWVDLYIGHEISTSQLWRNKGDGTFEDVTARAGVGHVSFTKGVVAGDYDNDGWPDLYVSNIFADNILYRNNGDGTFTNVAAKAGVVKPLVSFPTWFFDYDNDGWLDILVVSYPASVEEFVKYYLKVPPKAETVMLFRNNGNGTFSDVTVQTGLNRVIPAMGANYGDVDNDGFLDMYLGTGTPSFGSLMPNILLKNDRGRRFLDVTEATGTGQLQKGHGLSFADLDNDGDEEIVLNNGGAVPGDRYGESLYENPGGYGNHWISVRLWGVKTNRSAFGAKIRVVLPDASSGSALRYREVTGGGSFGSNSLMQHIGIGKATRIRSLEIEWPTSKTRQVFTNVPIDSFLEIRELDQQYKVLHPKQFTLAGPSSDNQ
jgi:hypothetical protein